MARRIVDYIFKVSRDDVGPRFSALERGERGLVRGSKVNSTAYARNWKKALSSVSQHGKRRFGRLGRDARSALGGKIATALGGAALAVGIKKSLTNLAELEDQINAIALKIRKPTESLADLKREIEAFTLTEGITDDAAGIASAVDLLVGADFELSQALAISKEATKAASAKQTNTIIVTKGLADILKGFKLEASDTENVLSEMIVAVDSGRIEFEDLSASIGQVISPAKKANASLAVTLGLMEALSNTGLSNPAENATAVARLLDRFTNVKFAKKAKRFGINVFDKKGKLNSPISILEETSKRINNLGTDAKKLKLLGKLFGSDIRASKALLPLISNMDILKKIIKDIENSTGRLSEAFIESQKRLSVSFAKFRNTSTFISRDFATLLVPGIDMFQDFVNENFNPAKGGATLADQIRGTIKFAADEITKEGLGSWFWDTVLFGNFASVPAAASGLIDYVNGTIDDLTNTRSGQQSVASFIAGRPVDVDRQKRESKAKIIQDFKTLGSFLFGSGGVPKINVVVNNNIDPLTGETKTRVTVDQTDLARRLPTGPTP